MDKIWTILSNPKFHSDLRTIETYIKDNYDHLNLLDFSDNSFQDISLTNIKIEEISNLFYSNSESDRNIKIFIKFN